MFEQVVCLSGGLSKFSEETPAIICLKNLIVDVLQDEIKNLLNLSTPQPSATEEVPKPKEEITKKSSKK